jgi:signal peptidase II
MGRRRFALVYGTALTVLFLDQLTKKLVVDNLAGRPPLELLGSFVQLRYTTNTGGAFSLLAGFPLFFAVMAVVVMVAIAVYARRVDSPWVLGTLGLLLGGALGNFSDRLLRGDGLLRGEVVDFVDVGSFPVFNVADSAITVGAVLLAVVVTFADQSRPDRDDPSGEDDEPVADRPERDAGP